MKSPEPQKRPTYIPCSGRARRGSRRSPSDLLGKISSLVGRSDVRFCHPLPNTGRSGSAMPLFGMHFEQGEERDEGECSLRMLNPCPGDGDAVSSPQESEAEWHVARKWRTL